MINWVAVAVNSAWILGLAIILAAASYIHWQSTQEQRSFREQAGVSNFSMYFYIGLVLIGIGLFGTSTETIEKILAVLVVATSAFALFRSIQSRAEKKESR